MEGIEFQAVAGRMGGSPKEVAIIGQPHPLTVALDFLKPVLCPR